MLACSGCPSLTEPAGSPETSGGWSRGIQPRDAVGHRWRDDLAVGTVEAWLERASTEPVDEVRTDVRHLHPPLF